MLISVVQPYKYLSILAISSILRYNRATMTNFLNLTPANGRRPEEYTLIPIQSD